MSISAECPQCHKQYQAPAAMAGRKVRCRNCGTVFPLVQKGEAGKLDLSASHFGTTDAAGDTESGPSLDMLGLLAGTGEFADGAAETRAPIRKPHPAAAARKKQSEEIEVCEERDEEDRGFADLAARIELDGLVKENNPPASHYNAPYQYPGSYVVDRWLPRFAILLALVWAASEAWSSGRGQPTWVGPLRFGLLLIAFLGVIFPIVYIGVSYSARKLSFALPPGQVGRIGAAFALPTAMAFALWLIDGTVGNLIIGAVAGLLAALPLLWLTLRLRPDQGPLTLAWGGGAFLLSMAVVSTTVFILNSALVSVLRSTRPEHNLTASPFGPGLKWEGPIVSKNAVAANSQEKSKSAKTKKIVEEPAVPDTQTERPAEQPAANVVETPTNNSATVSPDPFAGGSSGVKELANNKLFGVGNPEKAPVVTSQPAGGMVLSRTILFSGDIDRLAVPATPPRMVGFVGHQPPDDAIARWSVADHRLEGQALFAGAQAAGDGKYHLTPDGSHVARIASAFNSLGVQVWSFADSRAIHGIKLDGRLDEPAIVGCLAPDEIVLQGRRGDHAVVDVWNPLTGLPVRNLDIAGSFDSSPRAFAFSPDGKQLAIVVRPEDPRHVNPRAAAVEIYSLLNGRMIRRLAVNEFARTPMARVGGVGFTPDGNRIALLLEDRGQGLLLSWELMGTRSKALRAQTLLGGIHLDEDDATAVGFQWLAGGDVWTLNGASLYATRTGELLAELDVSHPKGFWSDGNDTLYVLHVRPLEDGQPATALEALKMNIPSLRAAAAN